MGGYLRWRGGEGRKGCFEGGEEGDKRRERRR